MKLQGQGAERGYAMAALLVSLAVMSVLMSAILPAWRQQAQREKEAELVFRGEQYARAIALFRAKNGNAFPPSVEVLVQGRYLRKKYLDPITQKDFDVIGVGAQANPQGPGQPGRGAGSTPAGRGASPFQPSGTASQGPSAFASPVSGGIMGVHSKSKETSIRIYKGQNRYDLWTFVFTAVNRPGGNVGGAEAPGIGGRGARNPGGRGMPAGPGGRGPGRPGGPGPGPGRGGRIGGPGGPGGIGDFPPPPPPPPAPFPGRGRGGM